MDAAQHGGECLPGYADDIVMRLLCCKYASRGVHMDAQHLGLRHGCTEAFFHDAGPQAAGRTEFSNFFKQVQTCGENPGDAGREVVDFLPCFDCRFDISDGVGEGKSDFLYRGGACFTDMVSAYADGVPFGNILGTVLEGIVNQTHRRTRREDVGAAGDIFFQNIVLDCASQLFRLNAVLFRNCHVHRQEHGGRSVDGHGS